MEFTFRFNILLVLVSVAAFDVSHGYLESVAASVISGNEDVSVVRSEPFSALVAFQCGYRNRYFTKDGGGNWVTDTDPRAGCLKGKLDILKYCRKVYPDLRITNIVESSHDYEIANWCKLEGQPCKWTFNVKPYRCIVGNFESEALLVPEHCHFGHVDDQKMCKDFDYWNQTAQRECEKRRPQSHLVKSFAMLEPCGLDMFSGVEFVCCPRNLKIKTNADDSELPSIDLKVKVKLDDEKKKTKVITNDEDDDDSTDEDGDDTDEDSTEEEIGQNGKKSINQSVKKRILTTTIASTDLGTSAATVELQTVKNSDDDEDDDSNEKATTDDPYFRVSDPDREYIIYRSAIDRLERRHREKVAEALRKLSDVEMKYQQNNDHDAARVEEMKAEFQRTMTSLEKEHHEERHRVEQTHEQRVSISLNERKRQAMKGYRQALSMASNGRPQTHKILKALQAYVRAEEKDRTHGLNRYRYLLRSDNDEAVNMRMGLVKKLRDIDLRINGTIEMTRDVADLMEKIKPAILEFWQMFRDENTPGRVDDLLTWIGDASNPERLLDYYKSQYEEFLRREQEKHMAATTSETIGMVPSTEKESDIRPPIAPPAVVFGDTRDAKKGEHVEHEEIKQVHAFALKESIQHSAAMKEEVLPSVDDRYHYGYVVMAVAGVTLLVALTIGMIMFRKRCSMHAQGFMAVDALTPEERHVSGMQVNGYENPTYTYFEAGKVA